MYAVIVTGGKQYKVSEGDVLFIEKLDGEESSKITFDKVLCVGKDDGTCIVGKPEVAGAKVVATVQKQGKAKKVIVFKFKAKKDYRRKQGHRQPFTKVVIDSIEA